MQPPEWAVENGIRLDLDGFGTEFAAAWARLERRFLKVESWQAYEESEDNESQRAYRRGDTERVRELLAEEAEGDRPLYDDVLEHGIEFARIRVVHEPLTDYLRYELMSYRIRAAMGENIEVAQHGSDEALPNEDVFDFLLFDRDTALIHDYGQGLTGVQTGGWLVREPRTLQALEDRALALRAEAITLDSFLSRLRP